MIYQKTTAYRKIKALKKRIRAIQGGTSASKTISTLMYLIASAQSDKSPTLTSIVSESIPHLKRGAMRDFLLIMQGHGYFKDSLWNTTDSVYTFETGSKIEFFSTDNADKLRGGRRDRGFMNECNNMTLDMFNQFEVRTKEFLFLDWNPSNEFWFYELYRPDIDFIILTYLDNEALDLNIVRSIEMRKNNKRWWQVYGLGQLGEVESRIYKSWQIIDSIPHEARLERYGLDFGYTNDPTALVVIFKYDGGYIVDEQLYQRGMSNKEIADTLKNLPKALIIADSAEPKSIDEIKSYGLNVLPAAKGRDSINQGIQYVQNLRVSVTKQSTNLIKEYRNYLWTTDRDGKIINEPEGGNDHALDALRYAFMSMQVQPITVSYQTGGVLPMDNTFGI